MINIKELFEAHKSLPEWLTGHEIFTTVNTVEKVFPNIGLENCSMDANASTLFSNTDIAIRLLDDIDLHLSDYVDSISYHKNVQGLIKLIKGLRRQIASTQMVEEFEKTQKLKLFKPLSDGEELSFKVDESLFKVFRKLNEFCRRHYNITRNLDELQSFKDFHSLNKDMGLKINFSSDGEQGGWDLLTMSMRGIVSCQSWTGQYSKSLMGSLLDPFTGIIYLSSAKNTEHGSEMIRRCLVRFIINRHTKQPALLLDRMYPGQHNETIELFEQFLRQKTNNKFEIFNFYNLAASQNRSRQLSKYYIPNSIATNQILKYNTEANEYVNRRGSHNYYHFLSYRDTYVEYRFNKASISPLLQFQQNCLLNFTNKVQEKKNISPTYLDLLKDSLSKEIFNLERHAHLEYKHASTRILFNYCLYKTEIHKRIIQKVKAALKENKDKHIFMPYSKVNVANLDEYINTQILSVFHEQAKEMLKNTFGKQTSRTGRKVRML